MKTYTIDDNVRNMNFLLRDVVSSLERIEKLISNGGVSDVKTESKFF